MGKFSKAFAELRLYVPADDRNTLKLLNRAFGESREFQTWLVSALATLNESEEVGHGKR